MSMKILHVVRHILSADSDPMLKVIFDPEHMNVSVVSSGGKLSVSADEHLDQLSDLILKAIALRDAGGWETEYEDG